MVLSVFWPHQAQQLKLGLPLFVNSSVSSSLIHLVFQGQKHEFIDDVMGLPPLLLLGLEGINLCHCPLSVTLFWVH